MSKKYDDIRFNPRPAKSPTSASVIGEGQQHRRQQHQHGRNHDDGQHRHRHELTLRIYSRVKNGKRARSTTAESPSTTNTSSQESSSAIEMKNQFKESLCVKMRELLRTSDGLTNPTENSDVVVRAADNKFYCHSFIIDVWAPRLLVNFARRPTDVFDIDMSEFTGEVVGQCLQVMYGGKLGEGTSPTLVTDVMKLASKYEIKDLKAAYLESVSSGEMTPSNACHLWYYATVNEMDHLCERSIRYILENMDAVANDSRGRVAWEHVIKDPDMLANLFYSISEHTVAKPDRPPKRDTEMDTFWTNSNSLQIPYAYPDLILETKEGKDLHVHTALIMLSSPAFAKMLQEQEHDGRVRMLDFDGDVVEEFLRALYRQEPSEKFPELVDHVYVLANDFEADLVEDACERVIAESHLKSVPMAIEQLKEAEEHRMTVAKAACIRYLYEQGVELDDHKEWYEFVKKYPMVIAEMIVDWESYRKRK